MDMLEKAILNVSKNHIHVYIDALSTIDNPSTEEEKKMVRKQFNEAVLDSFLEAFSGDDTPIGVRLRIKGNLSHPQNCGYPLPFDVNEEGLSAGAIYAIWFYATTGTKADYDTCLNLDIAQLQLLESATKRSGDKKSSSWPYWILMFVIGAVIGTIIYMNR